MTVSAELVSTNGMWVEYWNNKVFSGRPDIARYENVDINYYWDANELITTTRSTYVSLRWQTKLVAPYSETF